VLQLSEKFEAAEPWVPAFAGKARPEVANFSSRSGYLPNLRTFPPYACLKLIPGQAILVSMTRPKTHPAGRWSLQDAKARFSELVRRVRSDGPQHVTVHGRDEVVVVAAEEYRRLKGDRTGAALIAALQESPYRDIDLEPRRERLPVRDVKL
jgi:prevent-host-death family protein